MEAVQLMSKYKLDGMPVINSDRVVVGIITEYDLLTKGTAIHLPTFLKLFKEFDLYQRDKSSIKGDLSNILSMRVKDVMNPEPLTMSPHASFEEAAKTFAEHHRINPIPIVDENKKLVGILSRYDLIKLYSGGMTATGAFDLDRKLDDRVDTFLHSFQNNFLFINKSRTRGWLLVSLSFIIIGFVVATAVLLRISFN